LKKGASPKKVGKGTPLPKMPPFSMWKEEKGARKTSHTDSKERKNPYMPTHAREWEIFPPFQRLGVRPNFGKTSENYAGG